MKPSELKVKLHEVINEFNEHNKCTITKIDIEANVTELSSNKAVYKSVIEIG